MVFRIVCIAIALVASSCQERIVSPACSPDAPVLMSERNGVQYRSSLQDALRCSRETGRPILILFDAHAQSNRDCWEVLANNDVQALICDRLILCVLKVDDRKALSAEDTVGFPPISDDRTPTTIGNLNFLLETKHFGKTSQPLFTLVNADFVSLAEPLGYIPNKEPELLVNWIEATLEQLP